MHIQSLDGISLPKPKKTPTFSVLPVDFWTYQDPYDALRAFFCAEYFQPDEGMVFKEVLFEKL